MRDEHIGGAFILTLLLLWAAALTLTPDFSSIRAYQISQDHGLTKDSSRFAFQAGAQSAPAVAFLPSHSRPIKVTINGVVLPETSIERVEGLGRKRGASIISIPSGAAGGKIEVLSQAAEGDHQIRPVYFGKATVIRAVADQQNASISLSRAVLVAIIGMSIAIAFLLIFFSRSPMRYIFLLATFVVLAVLNFERSLSIGGVNLREFSEYTLQLYVLFSFLTIAYWTNLDRKALRGLLMVYGAIFILIFLFDLTKFPDLDTAHAIKGMIFYASGVFTALFNFVQIVRSYYSRNPEYQLISAAFALGTVGVITSIVVISFPTGGPLNFTAVHFSNLAGAASMMMLTVVALYFEFNHYRTSVIQNRAFSYLIAGHNAELDRHAAALKSEIERRAILEERQRFTRDMHDGIGGQLLSLLMKARRGDVSPADMESDIARSINDLRLVAASLDGSDEGLIVSLHSLRERLRDQLDVANIRFVWTEADNLELAELGPRATLNILRIMQEGATNAVRHSGATLVEIDVQFDPEKGVLALTLDDNGKGIGESEQSHPGKGMQNMRTRAAQIEGVLHIESRADGRSGTCLALTVPCDVAASHQIP